ncbi:MAG: glycoside hydrolase family 108 protein [Mangrovibacterium sp.]
MADFLLAYKKTSSNEGGYSNDPDDRGKETVFGISRANFPNWAGWKIVDQLKAQNPAGFVSLILANADLKILVANFYRQEFWDKLNCSKMPQEIADEVYDTSVNQGLIPAGKYLQAALNILNRNQQDYLDLKIDGDIGEKTIKTLNDYFSTSRFPSRNAEKLTVWLLRWMNYFQLKKYEAIVISDSSQEKWIPGWTERG